MKNTEQTTNLIEAQEEDKNEYALFVQRLWDQRRERRIRRERIETIMGHLGAACIQSLPTDDQIIMDHVREAYALIQEEWRVSREMLTA